MMIAFRKVCLIAAFGWIGGCLASAEDIAGVEEEGVAVTTQALNTTGYGSVSWEDLGGATLQQLRDNLHLLEGRDIALVLHWKAENIDDQARWELVHYAYSRGIAVQPWLTLPENQGYFPNSTTTMPGSPTRST